MVLISKVLKPRVKDFVSNGLVLTTHPRIMYQPYQRPSSASGFFIDVHVSKHTTIRKKGSKAVILEVSFKRLIKVL